MQQIQLYIAFGSVLLAVVICCTLIGCLCYIKSLHNKIEQHKSSSMQPPNHNDNNRDMNTSNRYGTITNLSGLTQLELVKPSSFTSIIPSLLQPGMKSHEYVTIESAFIKEGNKELNRDDSSSTSIHTDESQKLLGYYETAEGEEKETKIESAVHLEIKNY
eukprot:23795_1